MAKAKKQNDNLVIIDSVGLILAIRFMFSVIDNARDEVLHSVKNAPATYAIVIAFLIVCWTMYKNKKFTQIGLITLTILITSGSIWLFGLHS